MNLVIDASAGVELLLETPAGRSLLAKLPRQAEWWVPEHHFVEVASVLRRAEHRGLLTPLQATTAFGDLIGARVHRAQLRPLVAAAWRVRGHLTIADAAYVVLAEQLGASLVTADENLARSPGLAVPTITP